ncbi:MAG: hypothetical protein ACOVOV_08030, partial [Dolichospermum sp.]
VFTILSGPTTYNTDYSSQALVPSTIAYPISDTTNRQDNLNWHNMPVGTYRVAVLDSCGWTDTLTVNITGNDVSTFSTSYTIIPGCLNANSVQLNINTSCGVTGNPTWNTFSLRNSSGNLVSGSTSYSPSGVNSTFTINNIPAGTYTFEHRFTGTVGNPPGMTPINSLWRGLVIPNLLTSGNQYIVRQDTIVVLPYQQPAVNGALLAPCPGTAFGAAIASGTGGVNPSQYELLDAANGNAVIAGPQVSDTFTNISLSGSYRIRRTDLCGNGATSGILTFPSGAPTRLNATPASACVAANGSVTLTADTLNATVYSWVGPNGYTANSRIITLSSFNAAMQGDYIVTGTTVGGCVNKDTVSIGLTVDAGTDKTATCFSTSTVTMTGVGTGTWAAVAGNPGTATIVTPTSATTNINNFSVAGTYRFRFANASGCADTVAVVVGSACTCPIANNTI